MELDRVRRGSLTSTNQGYAEGLLTKLDARQSPVYDAVARLRRLRPMRRPSSDDLFFVPPKRREKPAPHGFVLDMLASVEPTTRPMFGCLAVYVICPR